jgi:GxxExxY protein
MRHQELTEAVIGAAIEVHKNLGPGLLESVYEECLGQELRLRGVEHSRQVPVPLIYKGMKVACALQMDFVVANAVVVELKSVENLMGIHEAQLLTYLRLSGIGVGLLINFNVEYLRQGVVRRVL